MHHDFSMVDAEISAVGHSMRDEGKIQADRERREQVEAEAMKYAKKTLHQAFHKMVSRVVRTKEFDNIIIFFILLNCLFMAMEVKTTPRPLDKKPPCDLNPILTACPAFGLLLDCFWRTPQ